MASHSAGVPWYYQVLMTVLKPLYRVYVWHRSRHRQNYHLEVCQRFALSYPNFSSPKTSVDANVETHGNIQVEQVNTEVHHSRVIWCHAVSLGETNTIFPVLEALMQLGYRIWLSNTTHTGFNRAEKLFKNAIEQGQLCHSYVPVDCRSVLKTFFEHVHPMAILIVETELWANMLQMSRERGITSILVNARLSQKSLEGYQKIRKISQSMMRNLDVIIAQDVDSAKRFRQLGADSAKIRILGSLKWVVSGSLMSHQMSDKEVAEIKQSLLMDIHRPIWVAASTHAGEEELVLKVHRQLQQDAHEQGLSSDVLPLLIIVPRHPERFDEVANLIEQHHFEVVRRSLSHPVKDTLVYLADTMGELMTWYAISDVAVVGGSFVDIGGHNPVEASSMAKPVLMGQYTQSCQTVVDELTQVGALRVVGEQELYGALKDWLFHLDEAARCGQAGKALVEEKQSVLSNQIAVIQQQLARY